MNIKHGYELVPRELQGTDNAYFALAIRVLTEDASIVDVSHYLPSFAILLSNLVKTSSSTAQGLYAFHRACYPCWYARVYLLSAQPRRWAFFTIEPTPRR
jgi:hypothetical protein